MVLGLLPQKGDSKQHKAVAWQGQALFSKHPPTPTLGFGFGFGLAGFHTYDYARHFLSACGRVLEVDTTPRGLEYASHFMSLGPSLPFFPLFPLHPLDTRV